VHSGHCDAFDPAVNADEPSDNSGDTRDMRRIRCGQTPVRPQLGTKLAQFSSAPGVVPIQNLNRVVLMMAPG